MGDEHSGVGAFRVQCDASGQWNVCEQDIEKPLASFDREQDAREYAEGIARSKDGSAANNSQITGV